MSMVSGVGLTANLSSNGIEMNPALAMMKATQCFENLAFANKKSPDAETNLINKGLMEKNVSEKCFLEKNTSQDSPDKQTVREKPTPDSTDDSLDMDEKNSELKALVAT